SPIQRGPGGGVIPIAHPGCLIIGVVILGVRGGYRDDCRRGAGGACRTALYHQYLRYGGWQPAVHTPTGIHRKLRIMAAHYRYHRAVTGYQPTPYVHPPPPPRPLEAPCACRARRLVPATDHRRKYQVGADVPAGQIKARWAPLHRVGAAERRIGVVPGRWVFQPRHGEDAGLRRYRCVGFLGMAALSRRRLPQPLAPEGGVTDEAYRHFVPLPRSWFRTDTRCLLLFGYALGIPIRYVPFSWVDYRHYPGQNIQNPAIHHLEQPLPAPQWQSESAASQAAVQRTAHRLPVLLICSGFCDARCRDGDGLYTGYTHGAIAVDGTSRRVRGERGEDDFS